MYNSNKFSFIHTQLESYSTSEKFDLIILADVLEHIQNDKLQLSRIYNLLAPDGLLLIYVPSCQFLFSTFDESIGHFRRYSRDSLLSILPHSCKLITLKSFDSVGFFLSFANKLILKSPSPSLAQISFWDKVVIPLSRVVDKLLRYKFGKNIFVALSK